MKHPISKKQIKAIQGGDTGELIDAFETLIYLYKEDDFNNGYKSRIADESAISCRLATHIWNNWFLRQRCAKETKGLLFKEDMLDLAEVIEQYFKDALGE